MRTIKIILEYDGTAFKGWQIQPGCRTVQGEIERALRTIFKKPIRIHGAGRTDSGVHALGQVAHFKIPQGTMAAQVLQRALNANLPKDVAVVQAEEVSPAFHARYSAVRKTYRYSIVNTTERHPLLCRNRLQIPHKINVARIRREARALVGRHDFRAFAASDPAARRTAKSKNTVRTISRLDIKKRGPLIDIEVEADGFLYKMVRNIVGALLAVGTGRRQEGTLKTLLKNRDRSRAPEPAAPEGLTLIRVDYCR